MAVVTRAIIFATLSVAAAFCAAALAASDAPRHELVKAELAAEVYSIAPGQPFWVAARLAIEDTWHINWINPGDAGLAPAIAWRLPDGFTAGAVEWPYPRRYRIGPLVIFGYSREVALLARITPPPSLRAGDSVTIEATVNWLACQEVCVPGKSEVVLHLPVEESARADTMRAVAFAAALAELPVSAVEWNLGAHYHDDLITIDIQPVRPTTHDPLGVFFFPAEQGVVENAATQELTRAGAGFQLRVARSQASAALPHRLTGVLVSGTGWSPGGTPAALHVDVALEPR